MEAEDVVQETLMRVWSKREEWKELSSIEAYCLTVARNLAIDRSERKDAQALQLTPEIEEQKADYYGPYDNLEIKERIAIIHRIINSLPEKQRTVMQLRDMEGMGYRQIAQVMDISEEQVKVTLFRARQKVRQQFIEIDSYGL